MYKAGSIIGVCLAFFLWGTPLTVSGKSLNRSLWDAARKGKVRSIKQLLQKGASVHLKDKRCMTALMYTAKHRHYQAMETLIAANSNVNEQHKPSGYTPLLFVIAPNEIFEDTEYSQIVETLLQANADVNLATHEGRTPLMEAAKAGFLHIVELLIAAGADVRAKDNQGRTALTEAKKKGYTSIIKALSEVMPTPPPLLPTPRKRD